MSHSIHCCCINSGATIAFAHLSCFVPLVSSLPISDCGGVSGGPSPEHAVRVSLQPVRLFHHLLHQLPGQHKTPHCAVRCLSDLKVLWLQRSLKCSFATYTQLVKSARMPLHSDALKAPRHFSLHPRTCPFSELLHRHSELCVSEKEEA